MSLQIKSLTTATGAPTLDNSSAAPNDNFNLIPTANAVYTLYSAANDSTNNNKKTAIVKGIRMVNTHTATVKVILYFNRPNASGQYRRRFLAPVDIALAPGLSFIDDGEITLEPGDSIQAKADVAG